MSLTGYRCRFAMGITAGTAVMATIAGAFVSTTFGFTSSYCVSTNVDPARSAAASTMRNFRRLGSGPWKNSMEGRVTLIILDERRCIGLAAI